MASWQSVTRQRTAKFDQSEYKSKMIVRALVRVQVRVQVGGPVTVVVNSMLVGGEGSAGCPRARFRMPLPDRQVVLDASGARVPESRCSTRQMWMCRLNLLQALYMYSMSGLPWLEGTLSHGERASELQG